MKEEHKLVALGIALLLLSSVIVTGLGMTTWVEAKKKSSDSGSGSSDSGSSSGGSSDSSSGGSSDSSSGGSSDSSSGGSSDSSSGGNSGGSDKGSSDSGSTGKTDSGDSEPPGPSKEDTKNLASDTPTTDAALKAVEGSPGKPAKGEGIAKVPEQGWVDGRWTGGSQERFEKGPKGDGVIPPGCTPGCKPQTHIPIHDVFTKPDKHKIPIVHQTIIIVIKNRIHYSNSGGGHHTHTPAGTYWSNEDTATLNMIWSNGIKKGEIQW